ncbi:DUF92 domain-containing protein [Paenibacillus doosanensis]|uniref:DUF92 domain-containing protein n=1 Tax=Paenibacillus doosanensis TaxID=1229154 RepID=UPI0021801EDD|nr:DUF92 domain-containing protein [Paenibacillus doosanensis]MCS7460190.1 DUF92 domain-containing protein [Paenibacillus doosanensis]
MDWGIGLACSLLIAAGAYAKKSLSASGAAAAVIVGTLLYAYGSLAWFGTLIVFFVTSSLLSKWKHKRKAAVESGYAKTGRRDAGQVAANGGIGVLLCIGHSLWPHPLWWAAYLGVMAAVNADTWATEIGGLSRTQPRSIVTGRIVPAGTSGGITSLGLAASLAGGIVIGLAAWLLLMLQPQGAAAEGEWASLGGMVLLAACGGLAGSLIDSWIGAVWQVMYRCPVCGKDIEKDRHCDSQAVRIRGASFMTNDAVNMISSLAAGALCMLLYLLLFALV